MSSVKLSSETLSSETTTTSSLTTSSLTTSSLTTSSLTTSSLTTSSLTTSSTTFPVNPIFSIQYDQEKTFSQKLFSGLIFSSIASPETNPLNKNKIIKISNFIQFLPPLSKMKKPHNIHPRLRQGQRFSLSHASLKQALSYIKLTTNR